MHTMPVQTQQQKIADIVRRVPARQWIEYGSRFGRETTECMQDGVIAMIVVLSEEHRSRHGSPAIEKFLNMGLGELEAEIDRVLPDDEPEPDAADDASFPPHVVSGGGGGVVGGGVVADGSGAGLRGDAGADVSVDGGSAV